MTRLVAGILIIVASLASSAWADDADTIRAELTKAKKAHADAEAKAKSALLTAIDDSIKTVAGAGDLDGVKALQASKKAFQDDGKVPDSARLRTATAEYVRATKAAQSTLEKAYDKAIKDATKALNIDLAEAIQAEWKEAQAKATGPKAADKDPLRPANVVTKQDLKRFLSGTEWGPTKFKPDGYVANSNWDSRGLVTRWEAVDRRTVILMIEKGRDQDRLTVWFISEDLTELRGFSFHSLDRIEPTKRKR